MNLEASDGALQRGQPFVLEASRLVPNLRGLEPDDPLMATLNRVIGDLVADPQALLDFYLAAGWMVQLLAEQAARAYGNPGSGEVLLQATAVFLAEQREGEG